MSLTIQSPVFGIVIALSDVPDPVFSDKIVDPGVVIAPDTADGSKVSALAPINGAITRIHPHAYVITNDDDHSVLIHLGLGTVSLGGKGFTLLANEGDTIDTGSPVIRWSPARIETGRLNPIIPVIALGGDEIDLGPVSPDRVTATGNMLMTWTQTRTHARSRRASTAQCVAPTIIVTAGATASEHVARLRLVCDPMGAESVVASVPRSHLAAHDARQAAQAHVLGRVVDQDDLSCTVGQRNPPVGILLIGAGLVLSASLPHAVDQGDADQYRGGAHHVTMQGLDDLTLGEGIPQQTVLTQPGDHPIALGARLDAHLLDWLGE